MAGQDADRVGADPEIGGVAEADHGAAADQEIERHCRQRQDHGAGQQRQDEAGRTELGGGGDERKGGEQGGRQPEHAAVGARRF